MYVCICVCVFHVSFTHPSMSGQSGCFHVLDIGNNATVNIGLRISFQVSNFLSFG